MLLSDTKMGTIGGTLMVILASITTHEIVKTSVLAAVGASVSFVVSLILKRMMRRRKPP